MMTLPRELTTVTPLSKYLAMGLFIFFPIVAFFLGMRYQSTSQFYQGIPSTERTDTSESVSRQPSSSPTIQPQVLTPLPTETQSTMSVEIMTERDAYMAKENIEVSIINNSNNVVSIKLQCAKIDFTVEKLDNNGTWRQYRTPRACKIMELPDVHINLAEAAYASTLAPGEPGVYRLVLGFADTELTGKVALSNKFNIKEETREKFYLTADCSNELFFCPTGYKPFNDEKGCGCERVQ